MFDILITDGIPTSVDFVRDEPNRMVAAFSSSHCVIYDLETAKPVVRLESSQVRLISSEYIFCLPCQEQFRLILKFVTSSI